MSDSTRLHEKVSEFVRAFGLLEPDRTPCGVPISVSEAHALIEVADHSAITQRGLAEELRLEKSTVSRLIGKLEARAWVVRQTDRRDRRAVVLALTHSGQVVVEKLRHARAAKFAAVISGIPPGQRDQVIQSLDTLIEAMSRSSEEHSEEVDAVADGAHRDGSHNQLWG